MKNLSSIFVLSIIISLFFTSCGERKHKSRSPKNNNQHFILKNLSIVETNNGKYGQNSNFQTFDFYTNPADTNSKPLVILVHSGAFITGDKRDREIVEMSETIASNGYNVASINYQLIELNETFLTKLPVSACRELIYESFQDLSLAVRYFRTNSEKYNINDQVYLVGYSAGAISSLNTSFLNQSDFTDFFKNEELECMHCKGNLSSDFSVSGIVSISGAMFDVLALNNQDREIPTLFIHGENDGIVNLNMAKPFEKYIEKDLEFDIPGICLLYTSPSPRDRG